MVDIGAAQVNEFERGVEEQSLTVQSANLLLISTHLRALFIYSFNLFI